MTYATCQACGKQCATWDAYVRHLTTFEQCRKISAESANKRWNAARELLKKVTTP